MTLLQIAENNSSSTRCGVYYMLLVYIYAKEAQMCDQFLLSEPSSGG